MHEAECRSAEKYNVEQNLLRIRQAVTKAGSIFLNKILTLPKEIKLITANSTY